MTLSKRLFAVVLLTVITIGILYLGLVQSTEEEPQSLFASEDVIRVWYTDEALTDYMSSAALSFYEKTGVMVLPILKTGLEYLEQINQASMTSEIPDLYVTSNDTLEKAYLAGLASPIKDEAGICSDLNYPEAALDAVTYKNNMVGYPFYYETSVFLYNKTYLEDKEIPKTIEDILVFAGEYDAPEAVEAVLKWDVSDIFYNYFFVGNYMNVGGNAGDRADQMAIYNMEAIQCLKVYQNLNQFFSIDTKEVNYESVLQEFLEGKIVFSVVTTDAIKVIEEAKVNGEFPFEYGITTLPDISDTLLSRSLSVTNVVAVNGYSESKKLANEFAAYLTYNEVDGLYGKSQKMASRKGVKYENVNNTNAMEEYKHSIPMPKMLETSNFWVQLEICFTNAWLGEDVSELLRNLSEQIMTQVTGVPYTEEYITLPEEVPAKEEYFDEGIGE